MEENKEVDLNNEDKKNKIIDEYIKRQAVLKNKFQGDIFEAPKSIQDEYLSLVTLIDSLTTRTGIWGETISSDGYSIDGFVSQKYEEALATFNEKNKENEQYITKEEEEAFEFPKVDFDTLREEIQGVNSLADCRVMYKKLSEIESEILPVETKYKLKELRKEMAQLTADRNLPEENIDIEKSNEAPALVNESKFAQIYEKAKGKTQQVFSKIKSLFKGKSKEENKEQNNEDSKLR